MKTNSTLQSHLTWEEMKKQFPDEWLYVIEPKIGSDFEIATGYVGAHHTDKAALYRMIAQMPLEERMTTVIYTGQLKNQYHPWRLVTILRD